MTVPVEVTQIAIKDIVPFFAAITGGLIGGFFAFTGIFINQRYSRKSEKRKLTREKLEEAYLSLNDLKTLTIKVLKSMGDRNFNMLIWTDLFMEINTELNIIKMKINIYSPKLKEDTLGIEKHIMREMVYLKKNIEHLFDANILEEASKKINSIIEKIESLQEKLELVVREYT